MDKVLHSTFALAMYISFLITLDWKILLSLCILAISKELLDLFTGSKFDVEDMLATLNPFISLLFIFNRIKERFNK